MAHELSIRSDNFVEMAFVGDRSEIWHGLGQQLDQDSSIEEWKTQAGMDWSIIESPVNYMGVDGQTHTMNDKKVLFRSDTNTPLSVVGSDYKTIQPGEVLEFFRDLVAGTGMFIETAGCLFGGKRFWAMANTTKASYVGKKEDTIKGYLMLATSADGTLATVAQFQSVRTVCNNTLRLALAEKETNRVRVTHRSNFDADMVKRRLGLVDAAWDKFIEDMNKLSSKTITDAAAKNFIDSLILSKPDDVEKSSMQSKNQADLIMSLYKGKGMGADAVYGNMYGLTQAFTEYVDHHSRNRTADQRLWNQFFGAGDKLKQDAMNGLLEMV